MGEFVGSRAGEPFGGIACTATDQFAVLPHVFTGLSESLEALGLFVRGQATRAL